ncbi:hypothetical protein LUA82_04460 [Neoehrlichia mikurensis]|uniref:Ankyrin repeat protein n=1 Tax=Neoehrlichia mikurensis TaxID=89586 RepID=A0A9Q9F3X6_9RICK|nr:hypothetical protein [Neoehrlichia mikurensis]UTO55398.1 hypothetical protein LUA82_04460 [Neoehrlichia mikurensis]
MTNQFLNELHEAIRKNDAEGVDNFFKNASNEEKSIALFSPIDNVSLLNYVIFHNYDVKIFSTLVQLYDNLDSAHYEGEFPILFSVLFCDIKYLKILDHPEISQKLTWDVIYEDKKNYENVLNRSNLLSMTSNIVTDNDADEVINALDILYKHNPSIITYVNSEQNSLFANVFACKNKKVMQWYLNKINTCVNSQYEFNLLLSGIGILIQDAIIANELVLNLEEILGIIDKKYHEDILLAKSDDRRDISVLSVAIAKNDFSFLKAIDVCDSKEIQNEIIVSLIKYNAIDKFKCYDHPFAKSIDKNIQDFFKENCSDCVDDRYRVLFTDDTLNKNNYLFEKNFTEENISREALLYYLSLNKDYKKIRELLDHSSIWYDDYLKDLIIQGDVAFFQEVIGQDYSFSEEDLLLFVKSYPEFLLHIMCNIARKKAQDCLSPQEEVYLPMIKKLLNVCDDIPVLENMMTCNSKDVKEFISYGSNVFKDIFDSRLNEIDNVACQIVSQGDENIFKALIDYNINLIYADNLVNLALDAGHIKLAQYIISLHKDNINNILKDLPLDSSVSYENCLSSQQYHCLMKSLFVLASCEGNEALKKLTKDFSLNKVLSSKDINKLSQYAKSNSKTMKQKLKMLNAKIDNVVHSLDEIQDNQSVETLDEIQDNQSVETLDEVQDNQSVETLDEVQGNNQSVKAFQELMKKFHASNNQYKEFSNPCDMSVQEFKDICKKKFRNVNEYLKCNEDGWNIFTHIAANGSGIHLQALQKLYKSSNSHNLLLNNQSRLGSTFQCAIMANNNSVMEYMLSMHDHKFTKDGEMKNNILHTTLLSQKYNLFIEIVKIYDELSSKNSQHRLNIFSASSKQKNINNFIDALLANNIYNDSPLTLLIDSKEYALSSYLFSYFKKLDTKNLMKILLNDHFVDKVINSKDRYFINQLFALQELHNKSSENKKIDLLGKLELFIKLFKEDDKTFHSIISQIERYEGKDSEKYQNLLLKFSIELAKENSHDSFFQRYISKLDDQHLLKLAQECIKTDNIRILKSIHIVSKKKFNFMCQNIRLRTLIENNSINCINFLAEYDFSEVAKRLNAEIINDTINACQIDIIESDTIDVDALIKNKQSRVLEFLIRKGLSISDLQLIRMAEAKMDSACIAALKNKNLSKDTLLYDLALSNNFKFIKNAINYNNDLLTKHDYSNISRKELLKKLKKINPKVVLKQGNTLSQFAMYNKLDTSILKLLHDCENEHEFLNSQDEHNSVDANKAGGRPETSAVDAKSKEGEASAVDANKAGGRPETFAVYSTINKHTTSKKNNSYDKFDGNIPINLNAVMESGGTPQKDMSSNDDFNVYDIIHYNPFAILKKSDNSFNTSNVAYEFTRQEGSAQREDNPVTDSTRQGSAQIEDNPATGSTKQGSAQIEDNPASMKHPVIKYSELLYNRLGSYAAELSSEQFNNAMDISERFMRLRRAETYNKEKFNLIFSEIDQKMIFLNKSLKILKSPEILRILNNFIVECLTSDKFKSPTIMDMILEAKDYDLYSNCRLKYMYSSKQEVPAQDKDNPATDSTKQGSARILLLDRFNNKVRPYVAELSREKLDNMAYILKLVMNLMEVETYNKEKFNLIFSEIHQKMISFNKDPEFSRVLNNFIAECLISHEFKSPTIVDMILEAKDYDLYSNCRLKYMYSSKQEVPAQDKDNPATDSTKQGSAQDKDNPATDSTKQGSARNLLLDRFNNKLRPYVAELSREQFNNAMGILKLVMSLREVETYNKEKFNLIFSKIDQKMISFNKDPEVSRILGNFIIECLMSHKFKSPTIRDMILEAKDYDLYSNCRLKYMYSSKQEGSAQREDNHATGSTKQGFAQREDNHVVDLLRNNFMRYVEKLSYEQFSNAMDILEIVMSLREVETYNKEKFNLIFSKINQKMISFNKDPEVSRILNKFIVRFLISDEFKSPTIRDMILEAKDYDLYNSNRRFMYSSKQEVPAQDKDNPATDSTKQGSAQIEDNHATGSTKQGFAQREDNPAVDLLRNNFMRYVEKLSYEQFNNAIDILEIVMSLREVETYNKEKFNLIFSKIDQKMISFNKDPEVSRILNKFIVKFLTSDEFKSPTIRDMILKAKDYDLYNRYKDDPATGSTKQKSARNLLLDRFGNKLSPYVAELSREKLKNVDDILQIVMSLREVETYNKEKFNLIFSEIDQKMISFNKDPEVSRILDNFIAECLMSHEFKSPTIMVKANKRDMQESALNNNKLRSYIAGISPEQRHSAMIISGLNNKLYPYIAGLSPEQRHSAMIISDRVMSLREVETYNKEKFNLIFSEIDQKMISFNKSPEILRVFNNFIAECLISDEFKSPTIIEMIVKAKDYDLYSNCVKYGVFDKDLKYMANLCSSHLLRDNEGNYECIKLLAGLQKNPVSNVKAMDYVKKDQLQKLKMTDIIYNIFNSSDNENIVRVLQIINEENLSNDLNKLSKEERIKFFASIIENSLFKGEKDRFKSRKYIYNILMDNYVKDPIECNMILNYVFKNCKNISYRDALLHDLLFSFKFNHIYDSSDDLYTSKDELIIFKLLNELDDGSINVKKLLRECEDNYQILERKVIFRNREYISIIDYLMRGNQMDCLSNIKDILNCEKINPSIVNTMLVYLANNFADYKEYSNIIYEIFYSFLERHPISTEKFKCTATSSVLSLCDIVNSIESDDKNIQKLKELVTIKYSHEIGIEEYIVKNIFNLDNLLMLDNKKILNSTKIFDAIFMEIIFAQRKTGLDVLTEIMRNNDYEIIARSLLATDQNGNNGLQILFNKMVLEGSSGPQVLEILNNIFDIIIKHLDEDLLNKILYQHKNNYGENAIEVLAKVPGCDRIFSSLEKYLTPDTISKECNLGTIFVNASSCNDKLQSYILRNYYFSLHEYKGADALHNAIMSGNIQCVINVLNSGLNINNNNYYSDSGPVYKLLKNMNENPVYQDQKYFDILRLLISRGALINYDQQLLDDILNDMKNITIKNSIKKSLNIENKEVNNLLDFIFLCRSDYHSIKVGVIDVVQKNIKIKNHDKSVCKTDFCGTTVDTSITDGKFIPTRALRDKVFKDNNLNIIKFDFNEGINKGYIHKIGNIRKYIVTDGIVNLKLLWQPKNANVQKIKVIIRKDGTISIDEKYLNNCGLKGEKLNFDNCRVYIGNLSLKEALRNGKWHIHGKDGIDQLKQCSVVGDDQSLSSEDAMYDQFPPSMLPIPRFTGDDQFPPSILPNAGAGTESNDAELPEADANAQSLSSEVASSNKSPAVVLSETDASTKPNDAGAQSLSSEVASDDKSLTVVLSETDASTKPNDAGLPEAGANAQPILRSVSNKSESSLSDESDSSLSDESDFLSHSDEELTGISKYEHKLKRHDRYKFKKEIGDLSDLHASSVLPKADASTKPNDAGLPDANAQSLSSEVASSQLKLGLSSYISDLSNSEDESANLSASRAVHSDGVLDGVFASVQSKHRLKTKLKLKRLKLKRHNRSDLHASRSNKSYLLKLNDEFTRIFKSKNIGIQSNDAELPEADANAQSLSSEVASSNKSPAVVLSKTDASTKPNDAGLPDANAQSLSSEVASDDKSLTVVLSETDASTKPNDAGAQSLSSEVASDDKSLTVVLSETDASTKPNDAGAQSLSSEVASDDQFPPSMLPIPRFTGDDQFPPSILPNAGAGTESNDAELPEADANAQSLSSEVASDDKSLTVVLSETDASTKPNDAGLPDANAQSLSSEVASDDKSLTVVLSNADASTKPNDAGLPEAGANAQPILRSVSNKSESSLSDESDSSLSDESDFLSHSDEELTGISKYEHKLKDMIDISLKKK